MARGRLSSVTWSPLVCVGFTFCVYGYVMYVSLRTKPLPPVPCACAVPPENYSHFPPMVGADDISKFQNGFPHWDDRDLIQFIRHRWLTGPSGLEYQLTEPRVKDQSQVGQSAFVDNVLGHRKRGFFIECGAANGETFSNTLFLEKERNWTGLLVEANPRYFQEMLKKHRKAFSINACLSTSHRTEVLRFKPVGLFGGLDGTMDDTHLKFAAKQKSYNEDLMVQCFPLPSVLLALRTSYVDYLSLDVEGPELDILQTIPFDRLNIEIISVEYRLSDNVSINKKGSREKLNKIRQFFNSTGIYREIGILPWDRSLKPPEAEEIGLDVFYQRTLPKPKK